MKHILNHFDLQKIITKFQHGFRSGHSCEIQLIETTNDFLSSLDAGERFNVAILDFSKAFDTVPHRRLLAKLNHLGIRGDIHSWITQSLQDRNLRVVKNGESLKRVLVASGVPQGIVLGPLLFLCYIKDLTLHVDSHIRLYADNCLLYRTIRKHRDHLLLQKDLDALTHGGMSFNANKCYILPYNHFPIN